MADEPERRRETIAAPIHDPETLRRAGWSNAEVIWEQIQEAAAECEREGDRGEATELWRGALELAREHLPPEDLRVATSVANVAVALRWAGERDAARRTFAEALALWDGSGRWVESLKPTARARSSTFHLRLEARHADTYRRFPLQRYRALAEEGRAILVALRDGGDDPCDRLARWRRERPAGFNDWRRLLGAVLLIAAGRADAERTAS